MKNFEIDEFDLKTTYQKLIAPSKPRMIKAYEFFDQPDLVTALRNKAAQTIIATSALKR